MKVEKAQNTWKCPISGSTLRVLLLDAKILVHAIINGSLLNFNTLWLKFPESWNAQVHQP